ncbi:MAG: hypothetical protein ACYC6C_12700, partial [Coriobacteriia bacterium]
IKYQYINYTAGVFAALMTLSATAIVLHSIVRLLERRAIFWRKRDTHKQITATA